jgi:hypothetical protein
LSVDRRVFARGVSGIVAPEALRILSEPTGTPVPFVGLFPPERGAMPRIDPIRSVELHSRGASHAERRRRSSTRIRRIGATIACAFFLSTACDRRAANEAKGGGAETGPRSVPSRATRTLVRDGCEVRGKVAASHYVAMTRGDLSVEFRVALEVKNTGDRPLTYDAAECIFLPSKGTPLRCVTRKTKESAESGAAKKASAEDYETVVLAAGATEDYEYGTNGYTVDLLTDAGDGPLNVVFGLTYRGEDVSERFVARLPRLSNLPRTSIAGEMKNAAQLTFERLR